MNALALLCLADTVGSRRIGNGQVDSFAPRDTGIGLGSVGRGDRALLVVVVVEVVVEVVVVVVVVASTAFVAAHVGRRQGRLANVALRLASEQLEGSMGRGHRGDLVWRIRKRAAGELRCKDRRRHVMRRHRRI